MTSNVDGHSWALCAIEEMKVPKIVTPLNKDFIPLTDSPVVVQQHNIPPQKFVLLSAQVKKKKKKEKSLSSDQHLSWSSVHF